MTDFGAPPEAYDAATLEHPYARGRPKRQSTRKHLPSTVLACRAYDISRGAPEAGAFDVCPAILAERKRWVA